MKHPSSRRNFLKLLAGVAAAAPALRGGVLLAADALPHLSPTDAQAVNLAYTETASKVDAGQESNYKKGSTCAGCALYQTAQAQGGYAPCAAFPGKSVAASGWCRAYTPKT